jgi:hypothetical protein
VVIHDLRRHPALSRCETKEQLRVRRDRPGVAVSHSRSWNRSPGCASIRRVSLPPVGNKRAGVIQW